MVQIPQEWSVDGLSVTRDAINAISPQDAPTHGSLQRGPVLAELLDLEQRLTPEQLEIASLSGREIVRRIKEKQLTSLQVTEAFLPIAAWAHQATGCLSEFFPEESRERAKELDAKQARGGPLGLLHGLPVSIKGHITMKGHRAQNGFALDSLPLSEVEVRLAEHKDTLSPTLRDLIHKRATLAEAAAEDGVLVGILRDQGAVFYARTTMPQSVMHLDTRSTTYGQTLNPYNLALSAGGSSGGEAALIAARGSVLGVGTDIGGSVRQPCAVTGLWGLRSTIGRIPASSVIPPTTGNTLQGSMSGPMCRHAEDITLWMQAVLAGKPWEVDPIVMRMPWRADATLPSRKLRIGVMRNDGLAVPITPVRRALEHVCTKLQPHVELVDLTDNVGDLWARNWDLIRELYYPDGGAFTRALAKVGDEDILPLTEHILSAPYVRERTAHETWDLTSRRDAIKKEYLRWWNQQDIDFMLTPACITTASRPGTIKYWGYTSAYNLFDVPGVVFPTGMFTDSKVDKAFEQKHPADMLSDWDREARDEYERHRTTLDGTPIGLQLIGARFEEEELLLALDHLCKHL